MVSKWLNDDQDEGTINFNLEDVVILKGKLNSHAERSISSFGDIIVNPIDNK